MDAELRRVIDRLSASARRVSGPNPAAAALSTAATPRGWVQHPIHPRIAAALGIPPTHPAVEAAGAGAGGEGGDTPPGTPDGGPAVARPGPTPPPGPGPLLTAAASGGDTVSDTHGRDAADAEWERRRAAGESGGGVPPEPPLPAPAPSPDPTPGAKGTGGEEPKAAAGGRWDELPRLVKSIDATLAKMLSSAARGETPAPGRPRDHDDSAEGDDRPRGFLGTLLKPLVDRVKDSRIGRAVGRVRDAVVGKRKAGRATTGPRARGDRGAGGRGEAGRVTDVRVVEIVSRAADPTTAAAATAAAAGKGGPGLPESPTPGFREPTLPGPGPDGAVGEGGEGAGAGVAKFGLALGEVTGVLFGFAKATVSAADAQEAHMRKLAEFSPSQAANLAVLDANRAMRQLELGENTAESGGRLTDQQNRLEEALQPIVTLLENLTNSVLADALGALSDIVEGVNDVAKGINEMVKKATGIDLGFGREPDNAQGNQLQDFLRRQAEQGDRVQQQHERDRQRLRDHFLREFGRGPLGDF